MKDSLLSVSVRVLYRILNLLYTVSCYIKLVMTSWPYSIKRVTWILFERSSSMNLFVLHSLSLFVCLPFYLIWFVFSKKIRQMQWLFDMQVKEIKIRNVSKSIQRFGYYHDPESEFCIIFRLVCTNLVHIIFKSICGFSWSEYHLSV